MDFSLPDEHRMLQDLVQRFVRDEPHPARAGRARWLEVPFKVDKNQTAELWVRMLHSWDYGTYRVRLDGQEVATLDLFNPNVTPTSHKLGTRTLAAGEHVLRFECVGKAKDSKGWFLGFDALRARVPVYARDPKVDLRTLQKR